jgi:protein-tyrosine phosphatase
MRELVVTAARDMDHIAYDQAIAHVVYPLLDGKQEDIAVFFDNFYEIVQNNIQKGSVLVHCAAGISRVRLPARRAPPLSFPTS